jgi:predicted GNAT family N-acyltransferase
VEAIELDAVGSEQWDAVIDGEPTPWGAAGADLSWARKTRHVGVLGEDGRPLALAGVVIARIRAGEHDPFDVVGIGGVIVTRSHRGEGLSTPLLEGVMRLAHRLGPERAMLFCRDALTGLYAGHGFRSIDAPVSADQAEGRITVPMRAMWAPLAPGAGWPPGDVSVLGEPF